MLKNKVKEQLEYSCTSTTQYKQLSLFNCSVSAATKRPNTASFISLKYKKILQGHSWYLKFNNLFHSLSGGTYPYSAQVNLSPWLRYCLRVVDCMYRPLANRSTIQIYSLYIVRYCVTKPLALYYMYIY